MIGYRQEKALFGGGCFWCTEAIFKDIQGVIDVLPGYAGGRRDNPNYEQVCTGVTGHAEVVQLTFDPALVSYADLLRIFYTTHDPTQLNRQGNDIGTQYRSVIFALDDEQERVAREVTAEIAGSGIWAASIVTELSGSAKFWVAEDKHHNYFERNPETGYCSAVVAPKVAKARKLYRDRLKTATGS